MTQTINHPNVPAGGQQPPMPPSTPGGPSGPGSPGGPRGPHSQPLGQSSGTRTAWRTIVAIVGAIVLVLGLGIGTYFTAVVATSRSYTAAEQLPAELSTIRLSADTGNMVVVTADVARPTVDVSTVTNRESNRPVITVDTDADAASVRVDSERGSTWGGDNVRQTITLTLPENTADGLALELESLYGNLNVDSDIAFGPVVIETSAGNTRFNAAAESLTMNSEFGNLSGDFAVGNAVIGTDMGNIDVTGTVSGGLEATTNSGNVDAQLGGAMPTGPVILRSDFGNLDLVVPRPADGRHYSVQADAALGDIDDSITRASVNVGQGEATVLTLTTSSGDISARLG